MESSPSSLPATAMRVSPKYSLCVLSTRLMKLLTWIKTKRLARTWRSEVKNEDPFLGISGRIPKASGSQLLLHLLYEFLCQFGCHRYLCINCNSPTALHKRFKVSENHTSAPFRLGTPVFLHSHWSPPCLHARENEWCFLSPPRGLLLSRCFTSCFRQERCKTFCISSGAPSFCSSRWCWPFGVTSWPFPHVQAWTHGLFSLLP